MNILKYLSEHSGITFLIYPNSKNETFYYSLINEFKLFVGEDNYYLTDDLVRLFNSKEFDKYAISPILHGNVNQKLRNMSLRTEKYIISYSALPLDHKIKITDELYYSSDLIIRINGENQFIIEKDIHRSKYNLDNVMNKDIDLIMRSIKLYKLIGKNEWYRI